jgi:hypothetical protein
MLALSDKLLYCYENNSQFAGKIDSRTVEKSNITEVVMATTARPHSQLADRTGTFLGRYKTAVDPIPVLPSSFTKSFADIGSERAIEILSRGKEVVVMYSGGIDSTYALVKLLQNATSADQITIMLNPPAVEENVYFYNNFIKDKLKTIILDRYYPKHQPTTDQLYVTGDQIPQLFGQSFTAMMTDRDAPWKPWALKNFESIDKAKWFLNQVEPWITKSPVPIVSIYDYVWWTTYSLRWNSNRSKYFRHNKIVDRDIFTNNLISFFRTTDFELWSLFNHDKKIINTPQSFKYVMKKEIYDFDQNLDYFITKTTDRSNLRATQNSNANGYLTNFLSDIQKNEIAVAIDDNFNFIYQNEVIANPENYTKFLQPTNNDEWYKGGKALSHNPYWY